MKECECYVLLVAGLASMTAATGLQLNQPAAESNANEETWASSLGFEVPSAVSCS